MEHDHDHGGGENFSDCKEDHEGRVVRGLWGARGVGHDRVHAEKIREPPERSERKHGDVGEGHKDKNVHSRPFLVTDRYRGQDLVHAEPVEQEEENKREIAHRGIQRRLFVKFARFFPLPILRSFRRVPRNRETGNRKQEQELGKMIFFERK